MNGGYRLGIDVGGTFTDAVLISDSTGEVHLAKVPTTPSEPAKGFLAALKRVLESAGLGAGSISSLVHGTTVATNALIEGKAPATALLATEGFADMLEIARQVRPSLYDVHFRKPRPLVTRDRCYEAPERLDASGVVLVPLDEARVREIALELKRNGIRSAAVCFLHSYLNSLHEERAAAILLEENPELSISVSSRVLPEFREYFRASTCVINACLQPVVTGYFREIEAGLNARGVQAECLVMQSNGGVMTFKAAAEKPVYMVESGPAAGVIAANFVGDAVGRRNLIALDMGGTTTKAGLILNGQPRITKEYEVGAEAMPGVGQSRGSGYPIRTPVIELVEIGAGGGSIAWVDSGGVLRVGPQSAGAEPGPICYGKGGQEPALTDANLVLGRINAHFFLGGEMELDAAAALDGIRRRCAEPIGLDPIAAAHGMIEIANAAMINALRLVSVRRGYDPRELTLVAFGGAAPLHANRLAAEMQIATLIVPPSPGTTSALGLLVTDLKHVFSQTRILRAERVPGEQLSQIFEPLEMQGTQALAREGVPAESMVLGREIEMRYAGQSYELPVECPAGALGALELGQVIDLFHQEHEREYGHSYREEPVEMVNFRVTAVGTISKPKLRELSRTDHGVAAAQKESRPVFFGEFREFRQTPIYDRYLLAPGHRLAGPAIVEEMDSTTVIHPGYEAEVDRFGNLVITTV
jgi:N-methylhydantoinase A